MHRSSPRDVTGVRSDAGIDHETLNHPRRWYIRPVLGRLAPGPCQGRVVGHELGTRFTVENQFEPTIDFVRGQITFLTAVGSTDIVVAELATAVNQVRTKSVLDDRPIFNDPQWYLLATGLNAAGKLARENGMHLCYYPHVGTDVQDRTEVDRLFATTDPEYVSMCLDTGHAKFAGVDPIMLTEYYITIIKHVYLTNVRPKVIERVVPGKYSFYQAIREGIFTVPGDPEGGIDFDPIFEVFRRHTYEGWIVVEAEQDPAKANPLQLRPDGAPVHPRAFRVLKTGRSATASFGIRASKRSSGLGWRREGWEPSSASFGIRASKQSSGLGWGREGWEPSLASFGIRASKQSSGLGWEGEEWDSVSVGVSGGRGPAGAWWRPSFSLHRWSPSPPWPGTRRRARLRVELGIRRQGLPRHLGER